MPERRFIDDPFPTDHLVRTESGIIIPREASEFHRAYLMKLKRERQEEALTDQRFIRNIDLEDFLVLVRKNPKWWRGDSNAEKD